jgi:lycopene beta-cyclase
VSLLQHFSGWFVERDSPSFDPTCATLMDFRVGSRVSIHFIYVLPFSETEALIESTVFSAARWDAAEHEAAVERYLADNGLTPYRVTRKEHGALPMTTRRFRARPSPRVYRMGLGGGLARPASGYAFLAIQRYAAAMATALGRAELPEAPRVRSARATALDHVFLAYLRDHPEEASGLFTTLFEGVDPVGLARFLGDVGTVRDDLRVMHALPARKLGLQAVRTAGQRAGRLSLFRRGSLATR